MTRPRTGRRSALTLLGAAAGAVTLTALIAPGTAQAQAAAGPIRIGEINSYKAQPAFLERYRKGWELAVEEVNGAGGVNGRKLEVDLARRQRQPRRCRARGRGTGLARKRRPAGRRLSLAHRPGRLPISRKPEEDVLPRVGTADRQDRLAERQPVHLPAASLDLHADGDAGARRGQGEQEALGHRLSELRVRPVGRGHLQGAD